MKITPEKLAVMFHEAYEFVAPIYGYETREGTRVFNPESKNGKTMIATCKIVITQLESELKDYDYNPK